MGLVLLAAALPPVGAQAAEAEFLRQFCETGLGAGQCRIPRGIAADPASGDIYVADVANANDRMQKFTTWGEFLRMWGWDVVASGPGDDTSPPEDQLEICVPANGDVCKEGIRGGGVGQFNEPRGVAVDSESAVYLVDELNNRVQKFDSEGNFLLMFGGQVNKTKEEAAAPEAEQNICPVDPGDVCQAGKTGAGNGQFSGWVPGSFIAVDPGTPDTIYVGDKERVQEFNTDGTFKGQIAGGVLAGSTVQSLAVSSNGDLYAALSGKNDVFKLNAPTCTISVEQPRGVAIATDGTGDVYVVRRLGGGEGLKTRIVRFESGCGGKEELLDELKLTESTGIATSSACGIDGTDFFVTNFRPGGVPSFIRLYGPPPDIDTCPPPKVPPTITAQHALAVDSDVATVRAKINPHFWPDTRFYVEYGTGKCSEGGCEETVLFPGSLLGAGTVERDVTTAGVLLGAEEPLAPGTTYHYRFFAQSDKSEAGPVFGEDPDGAGGEEASFEAGREGTFRTFALPPSPPPCPANGAFRTGPSAKLPDCRAYELVSPLDKANSDISKASEAHDLSSADGEALTYATLAAAYGEPLGAPFAHQYRSARDAATGWSTHSLSAPRKLPLLYDVGDLAFFGSEFKAFSEDLCSGWMLQDADVALDEGAPPGAPNLYRRDNCDEGEGEYELLSPLFPPGWSMATESTFYFSKIQGFSEDESLTVFRMPAALTQDTAIASGTELKCLPAVKAEAITYKWLRNGAPIAGKTEATYKTVVADNGKAIQCQIFALNANGGATQVANPAQIAAPYPATVPPLAPATIPAPNASEELAVGGPGGQTLSCDPNEAEWEGAPTFAYQWYRNGVAIGGASAETYVVSAGDLANAAAFQCAVTATNAGGSVVKVSANATSSPAPSGPPTPNADHPGMSDFYQVYAQREGELHLVSVLPNGNVAISHSSVGTVQGNQSTFKEDSVYHAVSADGSRIFWSAANGSPESPKGNGGSGDQTGNLYVRVNPTQPQSKVVAGKCTEAEEKACSFQISGSRFIAAATDGSVAITTSGEKLSVTDVDKAVAEEAATTLIAEGVQGVMGASDDASRVYFASTKALTGVQENSEGDVAQEGKPNLYLYEAGEGGSLAFIATLTAGEANSIINVGVSQPLHIKPSRRTSRVSPDGLSAAFTSHASLTGYDNADANSGAADAEVFLYDAAANGGAGELLCASCNPSGARPAGRVFTPGSFWAAALLPGWIDQLHPGRFLSADGQRLFFESFDALVPRDTNGRQDVYQWERAGKGDCTEQSADFGPQNGGCVNLISSGEGAQDSELLDASADGADAFFITSSSLLAQDYGLRDIYDARVDGGFPEPEPEPGECEGEACRGIAFNPDDPTPASSSFNGPGNVLEAPGPRKCAKGKVRRKGRCVRKHKRARRSQQRAAAHKRGAR